MTVETFPQTSIGAAASAVVDKLERKMEAQRTETGHLILPETHEPRQSRTAARVLAPVRETPPTPAEMLDSAVKQGASIDTLERLIALQERWEANNARKAFDAAIADAKASIPAIVKNVKGHTNKYADLAAITTVIDPILSGHGLSYRYRTEQSDKITVTCILSHRDGHSEANSLSGMPDTGPGRNAVQAVGSTVKYLMRYTLTLAIGIATTENDDDGRAAGNDGPVTAEQVAKIEAEIAAVGTDAKRTLDYFKIEKWSDLPAREFGRVMTAIAKKRKEAANG